MAWWHEECCPRVCNVDVGPMLFRGGDRRLFLSIGETMSRTAVATLQTIWDCKWSRAGYRVAGVPEEFQPESRWICVRGQERPGVTEEECEHCPHWQMRDADRRSP